MAITLFSALVFIIILEIFLEFVFRKLADKLILPIVIFGLIANIVLSLYDGSNVLIAIGLSLSGFLIGIILCVLPNVLKGVGEGDVKFLTFIGSFMGPIFVLWTGLFSFVLGSFLAILYYFYRKTFNVSDHSKINIPFGFSILIALIITAYFQGLFISS